MFYYRTTYVVAKPRPDGSIEAVKKNGCIAAPDLIKAEQICVARNLGERIESMLGSVRPEELPPLPSELYEKRDLLLCYRVVLFLLELRFRSMARQSYHGTLDDLVAVFSSDGLLRDLYDEIARPEQYSQMRPNMLMKLREIEANVPGFC